MKTDFLSLFLAWAMKCAIFSVLCVFGILMGFIFYNGARNFDISLFEFAYNSENVSLFPAMINTLNMVLFALLIATPLGIFGAVFLTQYAKRGNKIIKVIRTATETLAGIPSIVYGLFGYLAFVLYFGFRISLIAGILTLSIMILPLILRSCEEAINGIDSAHKEAALALGATKIRTIFKVIIPSAMPGILAGIILAIGKIVGESAALLYTAGSVAKVGGALDSARNLSVHLYVISSEGLHIGKAYSTAMVLIIIVLCVNLCANVIAKRFASAS